MTLTDEEWQALVNEHNAAMTDVETDLRAALEGLRQRIRGLVDRGTLQSLEADSLHETFRETLFRVQERLNAHSRRLTQMRREGEL